MKYDLLPHFVDVFRMEVEMLPNSTTGQVFELRTVAGHERPRCRFEYYSAKYMATLKPMSGPELRTNDGLANALCPGSTSTVPSGESVIHTLGREVTDTCVALTLDANGLYLFLPPVECRVGDDSVNLLTLGFFQKLVKAMEGDLTLRPAKLWLLQNWESKGFPDMSWSERYAALPRMFTNSEDPSFLWKFDAFKKCAQGLGMLSRRSPGPKPRTVVVRERSFC